MFVVSCQNIALGVYPSRDIALKAIRSTLPQWDMLERVNCEIWAVREDGLCVTFTCVEIIGQDNVGLPMFNESDITRWQ